MESLFFAAKWGTPESEARNEVQERKYNQNQI